MKLLFREGKTKGFVPSSLPFSFSSLFASSSRLGLLSPLPFLPFFQTGSRDQGWDLSSLSSELDPSEKRGKEGRRSRFVVWLAWSCFSVSLFLALSLLSSYCSVLTLTSLMIDLPFSCLYVWKTRKGREVEKRERQKKGRVRACTSFFDRKGKKRWVGEMESEEVKKSSSLGQGVDIGCFLCL